MARYRLLFQPVAKAEWDKLDGSLQMQFNKVLAQRLQQPRMPKAALAGMRDCDKIKLRSAGYRLVYQVRDQALILLAIAAGKREGSAVYEAAMARLQARERAESPSKAGDKARGKAGTPKRR